MDPFIDERIILASSALMPEFFEESFKINCIREAYGPTLNEGLCFECCFEISFYGVIKGQLYLGFDGYTKILLLPYLVKQIKFQNSKEENEKGLLNERLFFYLSQQFSKVLTTEMEAFIGEFNINSVKSVHNKLISLEGQKYRKYMIIFFLKDDVLKKYLGRIYIFISLEK